jgi:hypothetical protein
LATSEAALKTEINRLTAFEASLINEHHRVLGIAKSNEALHADTKDNVELEDTVDTHVDTRRCTKCSRVFTRKDNMTVHEKKCDGMNRKQCQICLKVFSSNKGTYQHNKIVKCVPPPHNDSASRVNNGSNSTYNNNTNTSSVNIVGEDDDTRALMIESISSIIKARDQKIHELRVHNVRCDPSLQIEDTVDV